MQLAAIDPGGENPRGDCAANREKNADRTNRGLPSRKAHIPRAEKPRLKSKSGRTLCRKDRLRQENSGRA